MKPRKKYAMGNRVNPFWVVIEKVVFLKKNWHGGLYYDQKCRTFEIPNQMYLKLVGQVSVGWAELAKKNPPFNLIGYEKTC